MTNRLPSELLIATHNKGKVAELRPLLASLPLRLRSLTEFPEIDEVEETGKTFSENAALKASSYSERARLWTLSDDSGLEVRALGDTPGVYSARYGGAGLTYDERIRRLLQELSETSNNDRHARFVCVIAVANPQGEVVNLSTGVCEGSIAHAPRGTNGFGYDPIFVPDGFGQTFGELTADIKEEISHRARALRGARSFLLNQFSQSQSHY